MKQFAGGVAVITGGASGFGKEFAKNAAGLGMKLVLADIQQDALDAAVAEFTAQGVEVIGLRVDVSKVEDVQALADAAMKTFGKAVSYTHLTLPTIIPECRSRWSPYH